jgi:RNA polymerase sigma factor (sigma-70 family)
MELPSYPRSRNVESLPHRAPDLPANADLVAAAAIGNQEAWNALVDRFSGLVWSIARAHRLGDADAADVSQTTWLRLVEHLGRLRDPGSVGAWLATTARHECLRLIRQADRFLYDEGALETADTDPLPEALLVASERQVALWRAIETLGDRCRSLIRVLMADPAPSYDEIAAALDMPIGSIGPTRARCLEQLRRRPEIAGI